MKIVSVIKTLAFGSASSAVSLHIRAMAACRKRGWWRLCYRLSYRLQRRHSVFLSPRTVFHADIEMPHPACIVIGEAVRLGRNAKVYQGVTIGGARSGDAVAGHQPQIGDNCTIFAGAVLLGDIRIGDNVVIGANSVVMRDVPDNCTAVGAPARIVGAPIRHGDAGAARLV